MIEVLEVRIDPTDMRIAVALVRYYKLVISVEICVYKDQHLWIRMPEWWITKDKKIRFNHWETKEDSDEFQEIVLNKVFDRISLDLDNAIEIRRNFFATRKQLTKDKIKLTLQRKNSED